MRFSNRAWAVENFGLLSAAATTMSEWLQPCIAVTGQSPLPS